LSRERLDERELRIFEYVRNNPGRSKEDVARGMNGNPSRLTVLKIIERLEKEEMITARKPKPNSQIYELFINEENLVVSWTSNINEFEKAFFTLLDSANQKFSEREANFDFNDTDDETDIIDDSTRSMLKYMQEKIQIIDELILIYRHFLGVYFLHAIFGWSKIADKQTLDKLHRLFFSSIEKIQIKMFETVKKQIYLISGPIAYNLFELKPDNLEVIFRNFQKFGLIDPAEKVLNNLWNISSDFVLSTFYMDHMHKRHKEPITPVSQEFFKYSKNLQEMNKATDWRTAIKIWKSIISDQK
jgi:DNA-binding Lrp family transcriptional regulator